MWQFQQASEGFAAPRVCQARSGGMANPSQDVDIPTRPAPGEQAGNDCFLRAHSAGVGTPGAGAKGTTAKQRKAPPAPSRMHHGLSPWGALLTIPHCSLLHGPFAMGLVGSILHPGKVLYLKYRLRAKCCEHPLALLPWAQLGCCHVLPRAADSRRELNEAALMRDSFILVPVSLRG